MNKIKIAFFDIDGTLLNMGKREMTPNTKEALRLLKQRGIKIGIATGRAMTSIPVFEGIAFDVILAINGSLCVADHKVIAKQAILRQDVYQIIENANKMGRAVSIATAEKIVANGSDSDLEAYFAIVQQKVFVSEEFYRCAEEDVFQIMLGCSLEERKQILRGTENAKLAAWWDRAIDIIPKKSGKGTAIHKILAYYQLKKEEAIAFGDGANDMDMLLAVGNGVAMGNAAEEVKKIASDVCGDVADDGIFYYLKSRRIIECEAEQA